MINLKKGKIVEIQESLCKPEEVIHEEANKIIKSGNYDYTSIGELFDNQVEHY